MRFNWPKYLAAVIAAAVLVLTASSQSGWPALTLAFGAAALVVGSAVSLLATWFVYDLGRIDDLCWFDDAYGPAGGTVVSVHVGYDDLREGLMRFAGARPFVGLRCFDEATALAVGPSLARALRGSDLSAEPTLADAVASGLEASHVFFGFTAHEIRDDALRQRSLRDARNVIGEDGEIVVIEHLNDIPNLLAYGPGAFHFHRRARWLADFSAAELDLVSTRRISVLVTEFRLRPAGERTSTLSPARHA